MSYQLDGIPTAIELIRKGRMKCPCGWVHESPPGWAIHGPRDVDARAALRFHYQNCALARLNEMDKEEA